jgi:hypothetical protein
MCHSFKEDLMKIVRPVEITDTVLVSSDILENDYAEWSSATTYNIGDKVIVTDVGIHRIYESLTSNSNKYPPDNSKGDTPDWLDIGATNRWKMFDGKTSTYTEAQANTIVVTLNSVSVTNSLVLFGLSGSNVNVKVVDDQEGEVYNKTISLISPSGINNWYMYYFEPIEYVTDIALLDLPPYSTADVIVTISGTAPKCALCILGNQFEIGDTVWGTGVGIVDYSRKEVDPFGNFTIVQRRFSKTADYDITISTPRVASVQKILAQYRATPIVWIGNVDFPETIIYGYYRDFDIVLSNVSISECSLTVEGL